MASYSFDTVPASITPFHYDLAIKTDIEQGKFEGKVVIYLKVWEDSQYISLQASRDLRFSGIQLARAQGSLITFRCVANNPETLEAELCAYVHRDDRLILTIGSEHKLFVGEIGVQLHLFWTGRIGRDVGEDGYLVRACRDSDGHQNALALTRFHFNQAKTAYPCWDEPFLKATFALSMINKQGLACVSCMPETSRPRGVQVALAEGMMEREWRATHFATTLPIGISLFAWAAGPPECLQSAYVSAFTGKIMRVDGLVGERKILDGPADSKESGLTVGEEHRIIAKPKMEKYHHLLDSFIVKV
ncbi:hypothetical protein QFC22_006162 [Naganishia vaughanmartiniae]|uniref:Uncharacterized protein n=1 Tax=Naganishia vaughanmartiniae TaxID=1424756 RepID=A0ACC2WQG0_9TREE|nr:hypothetical protein QFC22_006162 [Naganishia vaughanmartiniae]